MKKLFIILLVTLFLSGCAAEEGTDTGEIIDWEDKYVSIPEITKEYEIWFISDSHIIIPDEDESDEIKEYTAKRIPVFSNDAGVASSQVFSEFIKSANENKPDLILFGGDILDSPSEANMAFLKKELETLTVPYVFVFGNHDWTYPWEYMTENGIKEIRPLFQNVLLGNMGPDINVIEEDNGYGSVLEFEEFTVLAIDNSSNQIPPEAVSSMEAAYSLNKPIILLQHVPLSTKNLIKTAKKHWGNPVVLGMQIHGGIAPNHDSAKLLEKVYHDHSLIRVILSGHVHFPYEENISESTVEIITDAAYKRKAVRLYINSR